MIIQGTETLTSLIHIISESLLTPVVILLIIFVVLVILCLGGFINERISRKPIEPDEFEKLIRDISFADSPSEIEEYVNKSGLFDWQKNVLVKISKNYDIGINARKALASELISSEETRLIKNTNKTDILVKLGPILGLLGTLIPLGPGLAALGSGDITTLAESLTIAFDTTVTGLAVGGLGYLISKFKKQWYESDLIDVETLAEVELESLSNSGDNNA
ncbi:MotA/TolQ/ExbB proton channel family protein [uncultured Methanobrevibacter sp.]|uniref:MotA/TolQ/ExbB proton channel family protein n=1 Tax=Methanobrevibacter sp. TaxID=66852 RepID=UPI0025E6C072|nr:MotA/TolQ/ExbB proton channel family protein [uncultured Methanobrevibacter sp.]